MKMTNIQIPAELAKTIRELARRENRSMGAQARVMLAKATERELAKRQ